MEQFSVIGPTKLHGTITIAGAKNVALKTIAATLLTNDEVILNNVPHIKDVSLMLEVLESLGAKINRSGHTVSIRCDHISNMQVPLEIGARLRTSSMVLGPLLSKYHHAIIPNPGGCRIGARPIDRHIQGLKDMGASIDYDSTDGYFHATCDSLHGALVSFEKNTHTGTETIILAAVLANGTTVIEHAAQEIEVDDLICLLVKMGARIQRDGSTIRIEGVETLHGATHEIMPDRNEEVTFAIAAAISDGSILVKESHREYIDTFLKVFEKAGGGYEAIDDTSTRYFRKSTLTAVDITTSPHPGFMTDWQAPWAVLLTQAHGVSHIHETVFENRFSYVGQLQKMGASITTYNPPIDNPQTFYNFNWSDHKDDDYQAIEITGPTPLHNGILVMHDLRSGATLLLASIIATGESFITGVEQVDRGYEHIEERLQELGAVIKRVEDTTRI